MWKHLKRFLSSVSLQQEETRKLVFIGESLLKDRPVPPPSTAIIHQLNRSSSKDVYLESFNDQKNASVHSLLSLWNAMRQLEAVQMFHLITRLSYPSTKNHIKPISMKSVELKTVQDLIHQCRPWNALPTWALKAAIPLWFRDWRLRGRHLDEVMMASLRYLVDHGEKVESSLWTRTLFVLLHEPSDFSDSLNVTPKCLSLSMTVPRPMTMAQSNSIIWCLAHLDKEQGAPYLVSFLVARLWHSKDEKKLRMMQYVTMCLGNYLRKVPIHNDTALWIAQICAQIHPQYWTSITQPLLDRVMFQSSYGTKRTMARWLIVESAVNLDLLKSFLSNFMKDLDQWQPIYLQRAMTQGVAAYEEFVTHLDSSLSSDLRMAAAHLEWMTRHCYRHNMEEWRRLYFKTFSALERVEKYAENDSLNLSLFHPLPKALQQPWIHFRAHSPILLGVHLTLLRLYVPDAMTSLHLADWFMDLASSPCPKGVTSEAFTALCIQFMELLTLHMESLARDDFLAAEMSFYMRKMKKWTVSEKEQQVAHEREQIANEGQPKQPKTFDLKVMRQLLQDTLGHMAEPIVTMLQQEEKNDE